MAEVQNIKIFGSRIQVGDILLRMPVSQCIERRKINVSKLCLKDPPTWNIFFLWINPSFLSLLLVGFLVSCAG